jgi:hypothetical protein
MEGAARLLLAGLVKKYQCLVRAGNGFANIDSYELVVFLLVLRQGFFQFLRRLVDWLVSQGKCPPVHPNRKFTFNVVVE